jgi:hypothetical protein
VKVHWSPNTDRRPSRVKANPRFSSLGSRLDGAIGPSQGAIADLPSCHVARAPWLHDGCSHPGVVRLPGGGYHLRPIAPADTELDYRAVMGSQASLWSVFGEVWGWPQPNMTVEEDRDELACHEREMEAHQSVNYAVFDSDETVLLGCMYIDPPLRAGADAEIAWWLADEHIGTELEQRLDSFVPAWISAMWPFRHPRHVGHDIAWNA